MAGDKPRPRLKWHIFTDGVGRNGEFSDPYLAEDGCPDSQVALAAQLLENSDDHGDQKQSDRLAVYWLIKASEQGHEGATKMLQTCYDSRRGINKHNISDVKTCLTMSQEEKVSRLAARKLFINLSQGEGFITSEQLIEELEEATKKGKEDENLVQPHSSSNYNWCSRNYNSPQKITEEMLTDAASDHSRGQLPLVHRVLALDNPSFVQPVILRSSSLGSIISTYYHFIDSIGRQPLRTFIPLKSIHMPVFSLALVLYFYGFDWAVDALPSFIYYSTLGVMLITTCQILTKKWESSHFKQWSNLLVCWGGPRVNAEEAQWSFTHSNTYPCFVFLISFILNILLCPLVPPQRIPHSELVVLSSISALLILYNFLWHKEKIDYLALVSFGINLLARYPYETDTVVSQNWRFMDAYVPTVASYVVGNGIEFCLNFRVFFYLLMPGLLIKMASRDKWRGIYTTLVPHLISLSWWQMAVVVSREVTRFGVIRSCLAIVGGILVLPLAGITLILIPLAAVLKFFVATESVLPVSPVLALTCFALSVIIYFVTKKSNNGRLNMALAFVATAVLVSPQLELFPNLSNIHELQSAVSELSWDSYNVHCGRPEKGSSLIKGQEQCLSLVGLHVHWEGLITSTSIISVRNPVSNILSNLPAITHGLISCLFGQRYESCKEKTKECSVPIYLQNHCHLNNWNTYEYSIGVKMASWSWEGAINLFADHSFYNFTSSLSTGDRIWFSGVFELSTSQQLPADTSQLLLIRLQSAGCISCATPHVAPKPSRSNAPLAQTSLNYLLNFIFNPLIIFK